MADDIELDEEDSEEEVSLYTRIQQWRNRERANTTEGETGVKNLCRLTNAIGYKDPQYFGQFAHDGSYGDLIEFLEDNPGAVEAIIDWIGEQDFPEWNEALTEDEDEEE
jgi:hypothetical protein